MKFIKSILCVTLFLASVSTMAQQDPNRTFYRYNMNLVNPAYAGSEDTSEIGINFRSQWVGVQGAPETQSVFFSTQAGKNVGLGVSVINDRTFVENQTALAIDFSYRVMLSENTNLFFGVKAGANSYKVNTSGLTTFGIGADPSLMGIDGGFTPTIGVGAFLKGEHYFLSLSTPNVITSDRLEQLNGLAKLGASRTHVYLAAGYDFALGKTVVFKPSTMIRHVDSAPISIDLTAAFNFNELVELGGSYRVDEGFGGLLIFNVANWAVIGYAFEATSQNPVAVESNGTNHEVYLKLKL